MCGFFGWLKFGGRNFEAPDLVLAGQALDSLAKRGPDNAGQWLENNVFMGHRRLSIIDLSDAANQPFIDATGRYVLSFNGAIYNYVELRIELEREGIQFRTSSDTEVMLVALIRWGMAALDRFDGMFAGALHDRQTGQHYLFRDPLGQKPLYYYLSGDVLLYASELRALLAMPGFDWKIDRQAFSRFMMNCYYARDETPVSGVRKLLPGCHMQIGHDGKSRTERYWNSLPGSGPMDISEPEAIQRFEGLFGKSCEREMRSDVPYGVFLSGGIDSSLVLAYCRDLDPDIGTFTVAMGESDFDESKKSDLIANHLGVRQQHTFDMTTASVVDALDRVFAVSDEPHGDPGFVNAYFLAQSSSQHIKVALAGDGGDELFAGYLPFLGLRGVPVLKHFPEAAISILNAIARQFPEGDDYLQLRFKLQAYLRGFPASDAVRNALMLAAAEPEEMAKLCKSEASVFSRWGEPGSIYGAVEELLAPMNSASRAQQLLYFYQAVFLPEFVCMHTDRAAMQFGLEVRSPFLSPELIRFANRLPDRFKLRGNTTKWLPKQVANKLGLPPEIVAQKKQGFTFPIARWLKTTLRSRMQDLVTDPAWADDNLIDVAVAKQHMEAHLAGRKNNYRMLFNLMAFRVWRRRFPQVRACP
jgi:asparagine synthase (glutamine-hydrolysing)